MFKFISIRQCLFYFYSMFLCVRWLFRRKTRLFISTVAVVLFLCFLMLVLFYYYFMRCSNAEMETAVKFICEAYFNKEAFGNLCHELCFTKNLNPSTCIPNHLGKDVVFKALYEEKPVIIKTSKLHFSDMDQIFWHDENNNLFYPSLIHFYEMLRDSVTRNLNLLDSNGTESGLTLIKLLWSGYEQNLTDFSTSTQHLIMSNIWYLIQQPEYLLLKYHHSKNIFPHVLGSCGHFYIEEFIEPLDSWFPVIYPVWKHPFERRAEIALKIIHYLEKIEENFPNLQICDIKVGHFGLDGDENIKLLDMDMVFYEPALIQNMIAVGNCTKDDECSFIDCLGFCNKQSRTCDAIVTNDNFQRICANIFAGKLARSYFGLLGKPPHEISAKLNSLLYRCKTTMNNKALLETKEELKLILMSTMRSQDIR